ncbi:unnamed protein product [Paramecium pentaurelia]|uniref:Uncharacterized protein n=1 Tax=Paramecium pentaurelia TaxID=43138 RepID=A0A8S1VBT6_9CILI|nr:unnamed protein product [Paramecium pentaurelia]
MDDILKFQQQENSYLQQYKQLILPFEELIGLAKELDTRFQRSIRQLQLKQIEQNKWKNQLREKEQEQLLQLEQEMNQIDKQFKERLRTIHIK